MIRFATFPRIKPAPAWATQIVDIFRRHESRIDTETLNRALTSVEVLEILTRDLEAAGFTIEKRTLANEKIERSVFLGNNDAAVACHHFDVFHREWLCCLAIGAPRNASGDAAHQDLVEPLLVVDVDTLCLAVPNTHAPLPGSDEAAIRDYDNACALAESVYGHARVRLPDRLLLIGY
jgi:hypothetical protein